METAGAVPKRYLTIDELSEYLGKIPISSIYRMIAARAIPFTPVGKATYRFDIRAIDEWMRKKTVPAIRQMAV